MLNINGNNKTNIIIVSVLVIFVIIILSFSSSNSSRANSLLFSSSAIGDSYEKVMIKSVSAANDLVIIKAGMYEYGDVNLDGLIDNSDVEILKDMVTSKNIYSKEQTALADVNKDAKLNDKDLSLLSKFIEKNTSVKYDTKNTSLEYCISKSNNSSNCIWQMDKKLNVSKEGKYYLFVRRENKNNISEPFEYEHVIINYDEVTM